ncbi:protein kinase [Frankia sp. CNm7]|uniref:non-specific serine/threonine protein kinase n=1 Tax=Frankia nepalensis TaxID=1836974 RepID=A0A937RI97_9ACTN|nr:protein kinase [Frankia nepalensis]MBL7496078.1 protein kinase [Frankia nepalensis]MBL7511133.1 protein kinase [Frankia nepalensis]MBL7523401.1 protein kinase [Frankia nepalensis]MBL7630682.1 protein kinase [Frankia nepalensis]
MSDGLWVGPANESDRYQLVESLGGGGEGEVWRAVRPLSEAGRSRSTVAVKDFGPVRASVALSGADGPGTADQGLEVSWSRHVSLLQALQHTHIVRVLDGFVAPAPHWYGETPPTGTPRRYLVMSHIDARSLSQWCNDNPAAGLKERFRLARQVASALDYLHSGSDTNGVPVAHGDIKPANVLVKDDGTVVLVDFGLANLADGTGRLGMGTYGYMAPELLAAGPDARPSPDSDRFAFAAMIVYLLTGQAPAQIADGAGRPVDVDREATRQALARSPLLVHLPFLADLVLAGLAADPGQRPRSLSRWLSDVGSTTETSGTVGPPGPSHIPAPAPAARPTMPATGPMPDPAAPDGRPARRGLVVVAVVAVLVVLGGAGAWALFGPEPGGGGDATLNPSLPTAGVTGTAGSPGRTPTSPATPSPTTLDRMPQLIDVDVDVAQQNLVAAGFEVTVETDLVVDAAGDNRVVAQAPPVGARLTPGQEIILTVERRPVQVFLADLDAAAGASVPRQAELNGQSHPKSLIFDYNCNDDPWFVEFNLSRDYQRLTLTAGIDDKSETAQLYTEFKVFLDGRPLDVRSLRLGETARLDLDVTGGLRLRLEVLRQATDGCAQSRAVWGDPVLTGAPAGS